MVAAGLILGAIIRRAMRLTTHLDACADALTLSGGTAGAHFLELVRTLSPSGGPPMELQAGRQPSVKA